MSKRPYHARVFERNELKSIAVTEAIDLEPTNLFPEVFLGAYA